MTESLAQASFGCASQIANFDPKQDTDFSGTAGGAIFSFLDSLQFATTKTLVMPDRYECIRVLGTGGMSTVYMARHKITEKVVAIKFMHPHLACKGQNWSRFQREAKAAAKIYHPNVLSVYDCGVTTDGRPFLVMDYLEGTTLADVIAQEGPLTPLRAVSLFLQICHGLGSAHRNGVIHRDLKPGNVMIISMGPEQELVQIVDFGIAKLLAYESGSGNLTQTGEVFGSPLYMSPEQCLGQSLDLRSDIYSMGCLMYETLTGRAPFVGETYMETMYKQMHAVVPDVCTNDRRGKVYRRLARIISKALEKEPCDRYQTMEELQADLELALHEHPLSWLTDSLASKDACRRWRKAHKRQLALVWILIAVVVLSIMSSASLICVNNLLQGLDCVPDASKRVLLELWDKPALAADPYYDSVAANLVSSHNDRAAEHLPAGDSAHNWLAADCLSADCYRLAALSEDGSNSFGSTSLIRAAEIRYQRGIDWCKWDEWRHEADHHDSLAKLYWGLALLHAETGEHTTFSNDFACALEYAKSIPGARGYKLRAMILKAYAQSTRRSDPLKAAWLAAEANRCWSQYKDMH
ncbi:MAG TPA: serine/threonine-protein kinase [Trichormus sp.]